MSPRMYTTASSRPPYSDPTPTILIYLSTPPLLSHDNALHPRIRLARPLPTAHAVPHIRDHADVVQIIATGTATASGTEAVVQELRGRLPRAPVPERPARPEPLARPARLPDLQPVVPAAARAEVDRCAHLFLCLFVGWLAGGLVCTFPSFFFSLSFPGSLGVGCLRM